MFLGEVQSAEEAGEMQSRYVFEVDRVWKGTIRGRVEVRSASDGATCGYYFKPGHSYLVYAGMNQNQLHASQCTRTAPIESADEDIRDLPRPLFARDAPDAKAEDLSTFLVALKDCDAAERTRALAALASYPEQAANIIPALEASLLSGLTGEAVNAVGLLRHLPPDTPRLAATLAIALGNASPDVRMYALRALEWLGPRAAPVLQLVILQLGHEQRTVRYAAVRALQSMGLEARPALNALMAALRAEPAELVGLHYVECIQRLRPDAKEGIPFFLEFLRTRPLDVEAGKQAVLALTQFGAQKRVWQVLDIRSDNRRMLRKIAFEMLESMDPRDAIAALPEVRAALQDEDPVVSAQAAMALRYLLPR